jgi:hypothetical protein
VVEERRTVTEEYVDPTDREVVVQQPRTVVEQPVQRVVEEPAPAYVEPTYIHRRDPIGSTIATGNLIQTVVWAIVVLVLLVVGILVLVHLKVI